MIQQSDFRSDRVRKAPLRHFNIPGMVLGAVGSLVFAFILAIPATAQEGGSRDIGAEIGNTRSALQQWVETQRVMSQEKRDLALSKEILNERIELVKHEIDSLREKMAEAESSIEETDQQRAELIEENDRLKSASLFLHDILFTMEDRTLSLLKRVPDPIREQVKPLSQRIPTDATATEGEIALGERFANVIGILNEVNKFNRDIKVASEVRSLPDGSSAEVTALYLGIGQGYYTGANGKIAGVGTASEEAWEWKPANEASGPINQAIDILNNEQVASFVLLPLETQ